MIVTYCMYYNFMYLSTPQLFHHMFLSFLLVPLCLPNMFFVDYLISSSLLYFIIPVQSFLPSFASHAF